MHMLLELNQHMLEQVEFVHIVRVEQQDSIASSHQRFIETLHLFRLHSRDTIFLRPAALCAVDGAAPILDTCPFRHFLLFLGRLICHGRWG